MAEPQTKTALDESRMLVLGTEVLVGAEFTAVFQSSFAKLPTLSQDLVIGALALLLLALALVMSPTPYHQLAEHGHITPKLNGYVTRIIGLALLPFAVGLGVDLYIVTAKLSDASLGLIAGVVTALAALFFWYALEVMQKQQHRHAPPPSDGKVAGRQPGQGKEPQGDTVQERVTHVLTEARVVLPGVQALIGFQFSSMFTDPFDKLPDSSKYVHLGSIALMALAMILLMTPAAYHRIVEQGASTEHFHRFASRAVLAAMVPLALGVTLEFFVITRKITDSEGLAVAGAGVLLLLFLGLWFGFTLWARQRGADPSSPPPGS